MPLPLGTQGIDEENSPGFRRQLPLPGWEGVQGMYYPGADILYVSSDGFDAESASYPSPITYNRESIFQTLGSESDAVSDEEFNFTTFIEFFGTEDQVTFHHEFGHALLTKSSISRNISLVENVMGIHALVGMINVISHESRSDLEIWDQKPSHSTLPESLNDADGFTDVTWGEGMVGHMVRHDLNQKLEQNLATPVQEAFAWIAQAHHAEEATTDELINRISTIDEQLDRLGGWSLEHPGYDPLKHESEAAERQWYQYIWSFMKSMLGGAVAIFRTLGDNWAFSLISRVARGSLSLYFAGESIPDRMHPLPSLAFTNGMSALYEDRHDLAKLKQSGESLEIVSRIFDEWVGYGTPGLESAGEQILEMIQGTDTQHIDVKSWVRGLQKQFSHKIPSFVMIEDSRTNQLRTFISPAGPSEQFLLLSLLRWQFIHSLWSDSQQFLNKEYTPLLMDLARSVDLNNAFGGVGILSRCEQVFNKISSEIGCQQAINTGVDQYREEHQDGLIEFESEFVSETFGTFRNVDNLLDIIVSRKSEQNTGGALGAKLYQLSHYQSEIEIKSNKSDDDFDLGTALDFLIAPLRTDQNISLDRYIAETIATISTFEGLKPDVERLDRIRGTVREAATERDNPLFAAKVYGLAFVDVLAADGCESKDQWAKRLFRDFIECRDLSDEKSIYLGTFVETAIRRTQEQGSTDRHSGDSGQFTLSSKQAQRVVQLVCRHAVTTSRSWNLNLMWFDTALRRCASNSLTTYAEMDDDNSEQRRRWLTIIFGGALQAAKESDTALIAFSEALVSTVGTTLETYPNEEAEDDLRVLAQIQAKAVCDSNDFDLYRNLCQRIPLVLLEESDAKLSQRSIAVVCDCFMIHITDHMGISKEEKYRKRRVFFTLLIREIIKKRDPTGAGPVVRRVHTAAQGTVDYRTLAGLHQELLLFLAQEYQPTAEETEWNVVLRSAVSETVWKHLSQDQRLDFLVTLYGNALSNTISEQYGETAGCINDWSHHILTGLRVVSEDARSSACETVRIRAAVLGFAAARLTKHSDPGSDFSETRCWLVTELAAEVAQKDSSPFFMYRFGGEWIGYLTLFDDPEEGSSWIPTIVENIPFEKLESPTVSYPTAEILGRGLRLMGVRIKPSAAAYWHVTTIEHARTYARRVPNREAFLATFFGAAIGALIEFHRPAEVPGSLQNILDSAENISNELPDTTTLVPAVFADIISRLGPFYLSGVLVDEEARNQWLHWTLLRAAREINLDQWHEFLENVDKTRNSTDSDRSAAIAVLDPLITGT